MTALLVLLAVVLAVVLRNRQVERRRHDRMVRKLIERSLRAEATSADLAGELRSTRAHNDALTAANRIRSRRYHCQEARRWQAQRDRGFRPEAGPEDAT